MLVPNLWISYKWERANFKQPCQIKESWFVFKVWESFKKVAGKSTLSFNHFWWNLEVLMFMGNEKEKVFTFTGVWSDWQQGQCFVSPVVNSHEYLKHVSQTLTATQRVASSCMWREVGNAGVSSARVSWLFTHHRQGQADEQEACHLRQRSQGGMLSQQAQG